jgi:uncharacterized protein YjdB
MGSSARRSFSVLVTCVLALFGLAVPLAALACEEELTAQVVLTRTSPDDPVPPPTYVCHTIQITNPGPAPVTGELVLAVDNLPAEVTFTPPYRGTECLAPLGSPTTHLSYVGLPGPLNPGASAYASIGIDNPSQLPVTYSLRLLRRVPPTLSQLLPPSIPLMVGAVGSLTATLSSPLGYDTTLLVSSSRPAVATAPMTIPIPAGTTSITVPVTARAADTANIRVRLWEISAQTAVTVSSTGPTVTSLSPTTLPLTPGAIGTFTVTLSAIPAIDTQVSLTSSDPSVELAEPVVTVPAGQLSETIEVFAASPGTATITASLNGSTASSQVTVASPLPTVVSLLLPTLPLTTGSTGTLTVTLSATQAEDTAVALSTSDPLVVGLPGNKLH